MDGKSTSYWKPTSGNDQWLLIDLGERRYLAYFWWQSLTPGNKDEHWWKMKPMRIRIGDHDENNVNGNDVCVENVDHSQMTWVRYACTKGPMWGRYVVLQKGTTKENKEFFVREFLVYALA